ncbi:hypothetical protein D3C87_102380 [compost metagenome]
MKKISALLLAFLITATALPSLAMYTELGVSYGNRKTTFDANNFLEAESLTGSISLFFLERLALELSYTDAQSKREEKASPSDPKRLTLQKSQIYGADLILMFADRKSLLQPYIKGGLAQINRRQEVKIEGEDTFILAPESAAVPSYGLGLKIALTEGLNVKLSYDIWRTPVGDGTTTNDANLRAGITWAL